MIVCPQIPVSFHTPSPPRDICGHFCFLRQSSEPRFCAMSMSMLCYMFLTSGPPHPHLWNGDSNSHLADLFWLLRKIMPREHLAWCLEHDCSVMKCATVTSRYVFISFLFINLAASPFCFSSQGTSWKRCLTVTHVTLHLVGSAHGSCGKPQLSSFPRCFSSITPWASMDTP